MKLWECDFESPVTLEPPHVASGQWWQVVRGAPRLPGDDLMFQMQVSAAATDPTRYTQQHIIPGPQGVGAVLFQMVLADEPLRPIGNARSNWTFRPNIQAFGRRWIQRSRIYLQPNLEEAMRGFGVKPWNFRQLFEVKVGSASNPGGDMRMNCGVVWRQGGLTWEMAVGYAPFSEHDERNWSVEDTGVIAGRWFDLEVEFEYKRQGGLFRAKVDSKTIGEYRGPTSLVPAGQIQAKHKLAVLYTANDRITLPHWQYVDHVQVHSGDEGGP